MTLPAIRSFPLSLDAQRLWFLQCLEPESPAYNVPFLLRLRGALHVGALESAIDDIVATHELLRARIAVIDGYPHAVVEDDSASSTLLEQVDLAFLPPEGRRAAVDELCAHARISGATSSAPVASPSHHVAAIGPKSSHRASPPRQRLTGPIVAAIAGLTSAARPV